MASKNKLSKFSDMETYNMVFQPTLEDVKSGAYYMKGKWAKEFFKNDNPIVLELGCGKGEYTIGQAERNPDKNYIGIDIKGARIWRGAKTATEETMANVAFIRTKIDFVTKFFAKDEVSEIWCTFSDPQPKKPRKRLTSRMFIERYLQFLQEGGLVHMKTDSDLLFESTLEEIEEHKYNQLFMTWELYEKGIQQLPKKEQDILNITTFYEKIWLKEGKKIKYVKFQVN